ncbi:MAG: hypothetical protein ABSG43_17060 [Solirubrobacteraceae bacterium]
MRTPKLLQLAAAAAVGAVLSAGGYALASTRSSAGPVMLVRACADRGGAHLLHMQARCDGAQQAIAWNTIAAGSPVRAWAAVDLAGGVLSGEGATVRQSGTGVYQVSVTARSCARALNNAPLVTVEDTYPPGGLVGSSFPYAWVQTHSSDEEGFTVYTGEIINGSFTLWNEGFDFEDMCR